jgi:hypothetical protein
MENAGKILGKFWGKFWGNLTPSDFKKFKPLKPEMMKYT